MAHEARMLIDGELVAAGDSFDNVNPATEEFVVAIPYDDDDAVRIANDSAYGLSGGVHSASLERAMAVARRVRTGGMSINGGAPNAADMPFGGYKDSGVGRQNGTAGFDQYLELKAVAWPA